MRQICQLCGNEKPEILHNVFSKEADAQQEMILVCENCMSQFEEPEFVFQRFDGKIFTLEELPKFWKNDVAIHYEHNHIICYRMEQELAHLHSDEERARYIQRRSLDPTRLPLDKFPLVEDFEIWLMGGFYRQGSRRSTISDFGVIFYSPSHGRVLGSTDDWSSKLCKPDYVIPHGDFTLPYYYFEQGISLLLFEDEQFVYVLCGDDDLEKGYETWCKVTRRRYYAEWEHAIECSRAFHSSRNDSDVSSR